MAKPWLGAACAEAISLLRSLCRLTMTLSRCLGALGACLLGGMRPPFSQTPPQGWRAPIALIGSVPQLLSFNPRPWTCRGRRLVPRSRKTRGPTNGVSAQLPGPSVMPTVRYSTTPKALQSGRPPHASCLSCKSHAQTAPRSSGLVAVCPNNVTIKAKCLSGAKSSAHSVVATWLAISCHIYALASGVE